MQSRMSMKKKPFLLFWTACTVHGVEGARGNPISKYFNWIIGFVSIENILAEEVAEHIRTEICIRIYLYCTNVWR